MKTHIPELQDIAEGTLIQITGETGVGKTKFCLERFETNEEPEYITFYKPETTSRLITGKPEGSVPYFKDTYKRRK